MKVKWYLKVNLYLKVIWYLKVLWYLKVVYYIWKSYMIFESLIWYLKVVYDIWWPYLIQVDICLIFESQLIFEGQLVFKIHMIFESPVIFESQMIFESLIWYLMTIPHPGWETLEWELSWLDSPSELQLLLLWSDNQHNRYFHHPLLAFYGWPRRPKNNHLRTEYIWMMQEI